MDSNYLEYLATLLLDGEISNKDAERLSKLEKAENIYRIVEEDEGIIKVVSNEGKTLSYIQYSLEFNSCNENVLIINNAESFERVNGHFKNLYNHLENLAGKENVLCINFEICEDNFLIKDILEKYGFVHVSDISDFCCSSNDTICMKKYLK